ncbi:COL10A [Mytilus coruscus]|uniref:COL10A n=1 Tax=Mytilus coruscus TaxID=42192 RepID=A0A6J8ELD1_MYTCO|nr:COL10A [Mytilus coruscus]
MLQGCAIFLFTISLNVHVLANSCENDTCTAAIDIPLITKLNAPLKAELDISVLTIQLKELIVNEVKQAVSVAMKDLTENIVDKRAKSALENLQADNNLTLSTFLHEIEVKMEKSNALLMSKQNISANEIHSLTTMNDKFGEKIEQLKEKQTLTESRLSLVESDVKRTTKRVAMTAHPSKSETVKNTIMKFDDVKYSVGITNLSSYKTTGKFTFEHKGLYLISASSDVRYYIKLNETIISYTYIGQHGGGQVFAGAVTVTRKLNPNDQVWLYAPGSWFLYSGLHSRLTIIKIK